MGGVGGRLLGSEATRAGFGESFVVRSLWCLSQFVELIKDKIVGSGSETMSAN